MKRLITEMKLNSNEVNNKFRFKSLGTLLKLNCQSQTIKVKLVNADELFPIKIASRSKIDLKRTTFQHFKRQSATCQGLGIKLLTPDILTFAYWTASNSKRMFVNSMN